MSLKTMKGFSNWLDNTWFTIKQNCLHSDIQDIEYGIGILEKGGFWAFLYRLECNTSYKPEEQIRVLKLLKKHKEALIILRGEQRKELEALNKEFMMKKQGEAGR